MHKNKVLICGATGFIGRNIAEKLAKREDIELYGTYLDSEPLINLNIKMIKADLTKKEDVEKVVKGMNIIIQAAATTSGVKDIQNQPYYHVTDNAIMNSLIFRAAHEYGISHVIFFSCTVMYQSKNKPFLDFPVKETDYNPNEEIHPKYFGVGMTKVYIERMCEFFSRLGRTKYTVIRHSNIYGPHDKFDLEKSHVFGATMTKVLTNKSGEIVVWGTGEEERDLLYISDLVEFVELALDKQKEQFELVNVGLGSSISINDLVSKIIQKSGKSIKIKYDVSKPTIKTKLFLDITKAYRIFEWKPQISLEEGIQRTIIWYKNNIKTE
jgi:nucleoside-diphosphate-sugar epimerase